MLLFYSKTEIKKPHYSELKESQIVLLCIPAVKAAYSYYNYVVSAVIRCHDSSVIMKANHCYSGFVGSKSTTAEKKKKKVYITFGPKENIKEVIKFDL